MALKEAEDKLQQTLKTEMDQYGAFVQRVPSDEEKWLASVRTSSTGADGLLLAGRISFAAVSRVNCSADSLERPYGDSGVSITVSRLIARAPLAVRSFIGAVAR